MQWLPFFGLQIVSLQPTSTWPQVDMQGDFCIILFLWEDFGFTEHEKQNLNFY